MSGSKYTPDSEAENDAKPEIPAVKDRRWITWVEPFGPNMEPVYMFVPVKTAIAAMRSSATKIKGYEYPDDDSALEDFIVLNWATLCEMPNG